MTLHADTPREQTIDIAARSIAYFSMEIALSPILPTYSGGLGILAGDTLRSAADMELPMVAFSLAYRRGYFRQHLNQEGIQSETAQPWSPEHTLPSCDCSVTVGLNGRDVVVRAWRFDVRGVTGHLIPVFLLDTDCSSNHDAWDRSLTDTLYGGDAYYRLSQEGILGLAGIKFLEAMGCRPSVYHLNEGHAALLALGLVEQKFAGDSFHSVQEKEVAYIKQSCVFTTHTPVPAGHDCFGSDQVYRVLGGARGALLERIGCLHDGALNMTHLALRCSRHVNGVAMQHGKVSQRMFPDYPISAITNGVHAATWLSARMQGILDAEIPEWRTDNHYLRSVYGIPSELVFHTHRLNKVDLLKTVEARTLCRLDPSILTLGFARRVATYKRAHLLFSDLARLSELAEAMGGLQILYAGKAHPADRAGKQLIEQVHAAASAIKTTALKVIYLENYDWTLGALLTQGVDVWVNTPLRPYEASGTSGMKAALNGIPSLSTMDGWWIEGCVEGLTGWAIEESDSELEEATSLYDKLQSSVGPLYADKAKWALMQRHCIALNGGFFNTHRMLAQYAHNVYGRAAVTDNFDIAPPKSSIIGRTNEWRTQ